MNYACIHNNANIVWYPTKTLRESKGTLVENHSAKCLKFIYFQAKTNSAICFLTQGTTLYHFTFRNVCSPKKCQERIAENTYYRDKENLNWSQNAHKVGINSMKHEMNIHLSFIFENRLWQDLWKDMGGVDSSER